MNECPKDVFDPIIFELEFHNMNDTLSRFKLTSAYIQDIK